MNISIQFDTHLSENWKHLIGNMIMVAKLTVKINIKTQQESFEQ